MLQMPEKFNLKDKNFKKKKKKVFVVRFPGWEYLHLI